MIEEKEGAFEVVFCPDLSTGKYPEDADPSGKRVDFYGYDTYEEAKNVFDKVKPEDGEEILLMQAIGEDKRVLETK